MQTCKERSNFFSIHNVAFILLSAAVYYLAALGGHLKDLPFNYAICSGLALACVLIWGKRILPGIFLGSFLFNLVLFSDLFLQSPLEVVIASSGIGIGATLQAFMGYFLIRRYISIKLFEKASYVFKFIVIGMISCLVNSSLTLLFLNLIQKNYGVEHWWIEWTGSLLGILIFTPFFLSCSRQKFVTIDSSRWGEALLLYAFSVLFIFIIFDSPYDLTYALIALVMWAGFRLNLRQTTLAIGLIFSLILWETIQGKGPFFIPQAINTSLLLVHSFFIIVASLGLLLVASLCEQRRAKQLLVKYNQNLENKVQDRTKEICAQLEKIKAMQQQMIVADKLACLGTLIAGVAHEIKNPLNFITNFSESSIELIGQIQSDLEIHKDQVSKIGDIQTNLDFLSLNNTKILEHAKRADTIVKDMLLHAREGTLGVQKFDLNALIQEYTKLAYCSKKQKNSSLAIHFIMDLDVSILSIEANQQQLSRVILNIIDNALDALETKIHLMTEAFKPEIKIHTKDCEKEVEITICDNGIGISPALINKIFIPFFTQKPLGKGTGLGLAIAYDIVVKEHGGTLECDSKEGEFTVFKIVLPKFQGNTSA